MDNVMVCRLLSQKSKENLAIIISNIKANRRYVQLLDILECNSAN